jgi:hypothetical protein
MGNASPCLSGIKRFIGAFAGTRAADALGVLGEVCYVLNAHCDVMVRLGRWSALDLQGPATRLGSIPNTHT